MIGIRFKISNEYNTFLYKIFKNVDSQAFIWKVLEEESYKQDGSELFDKDEYSNTDFKNLIKNNMYYTIFINIQLYKESINNIDILNYSDFINSSCELIIFITDNEYVDIYSKDEYILKIIKDNAISNNFSNIEIISKDSHIRNRFSAYAD